MEGKPLRPIIDVDHISVRARKRLLFREASWTVHEGETWAIVGPNGSGKSTLVRALRGELPLASGEVRLWFPMAPGRPPREPHEAIAHVSFDAQSHLLRGASGFHQSRWHAGEDEGALTARDVLGPPSPLRRRAVALLGLGGLLARKVTHLSSGERRKLLVARAVIDEPDLIVLDNPFTGLDRRSRASLLASLRRLLRSRLRLLIVTARADEVPDEATHVLLVDRGCVALAGTRDRVLRSRAFHEAMRPPRKAPGRKVASGAGRAEEAVIEMRDVTIRYGRARALDRVSWTVRRGERWAVLGPNGAGKTTLLSLVLADHPQAYANDVRLFGARRGSGESIWEIKRKIGCVSPESHMFHERRGTALEAVCSGLHDAAGLYRVPSSGEMAEATRWLRRMGLSRVADVPLGRLSEGEQRLVLLARALVKRPEMLVLDEPCQGLDSANRRRFLRVLETLLRRSRLTVLYVTHECEEIPAGFTRVLRLEKGGVARRPPSF